MPRKSTTKLPDDAVLLKKRVAELEEEKKLRDEDTDNVKMDSYIEVMSLCPYTLTLHTESLGKGKKFEFKSFGEVKRIIYVDLIDIFEINRSFLETGRFYILNASVIRKHGLNDIYSKLLDKEMMNKIIECDSRNAVKLYEMANKVQRELVEIVLIDKIKNGEADLNVISQISVLAGKDLAKLANEEKQLETQPA